MAPPLPAAGTRALRRWRWPVIAMVAALGALAAVAIVVEQPRGRTQAGAAPGGCSDGMIAIPAGRFAMGSPDGEGDADEHPRHDVTLSAYCIDRTEVTVAAYWVCVAAGGCSAPSMTVNWPSYSTEDVTRFSRWCNGGERLDHPINCVDWDDAAAYCAWRGARLPTEAEWEYAARGGDGRTHPWGNDAPTASRLNACGGECMAMASRERIPWKAMHDGDDGWPTTAPVGRYPQGASPFGALDMAGNVWEWTADWYGPYAASAQTDPTGATAGTSRVSRGGGWTSGGDDRARAADRDWIDPKVREASLGFRCARPG